jgi:hypothetical protein
LGKLIVTGKSQIFQPLAEEFEAKKSAKICVVKHLRYMRAINERTI